MAPVSVISAGQTKGRYAQCQQNGMQEALALLWYASNNNSKRFSRMFNSHYAKRWDVSKNCQVSGGAGYIGLTVGFAGAPMRDPISDHCTDTQGDGDRLIRIFADESVGRFSAPDRFLTDPSKQLLAVLQCGCELFTSLRDFISCDARSGG